MRRAEFQLRQRFIARARFADAETAGRVPLEVRIRLAVLRPLHQVLLPYVDLRDIGQAARLPRRLRHPDVGSRRLCPCGGCRSRRFRLFRQPFVLRKLCDHLLDDACQCSFVQHSHFLSYFAKKTEASPALGVSFPFSEKPIFSSQRSNSGMGRRPKTSRSAGIS